jgi:hypothetical protein
MTIKKYLLHPYFRIIMVGTIVLFLLNSCESGLENGNVVKNPTVIANTNTVPDAVKDFTERDLKFKGKQAVITRHARCRMGCREIDAFEIQEVIDQDNINYRKNKPAQAGRCASIAYEGTTRDQQHVRIIVGDCDRDPIIITVIDLGNKYNCTCD